MRIIRGLSSLVVLVAAGCKTAPAMIDQSTVPAAPPPAQSTADDPAPQGPIAAYIDGQPVRWGELTTPLVERGGGEILTEQVLTRLVEKRLAEYGLTVAEEQITAEADRMRRTLHPDASQAQRMLNELRRRRGLGGARWNQLLRRNAGMRLLVQGEAIVTDDAVRQTYDMKFGPRYEARLIVVDSGAKASTIVRQAKGGASFVDLAVAHSTDSSRAQGGLLDPISPADPTWPVAVREAVVRLGVGEVSPPIAIDQGFAILKLERKTEASNVPIDDVKEELSAQVRLDLESVLMRRLAKTLLDEADVVILDPALKRRYEEHSQP